MRAKVTWTGIFFLMQVSFLAFPGIVFSSETEKLEFGFPMKKGKQVFYWGDFSTPRVTQSGGVLFSSYSEEKSAIPSYPPFVTTSEYIFTGRTGEKTFEIEARSKISGRAEEKTTLKLYLEEGLSIPLPYSWMGTYCTREDKATLKIYALKGNGIETQVFLPECLKRTGAK